MSAISRRITFVAAAVAMVCLAAVALVASQSSLVAIGATDPPGSGVTLKILSASIPGDGKPEVTFSLTDAKGIPIRVSDVDEGGLRFLIAAVREVSETKSTEYVNYVVNNVAGRDYQFEGKTNKTLLASATQPGVDTGGVFTDLGSGKFTYKFNKAVPSDYKASETHALAGYVTRNARAFVSNDAFYFVPAGGTPAPREVVKLESCNACHDALAFHGGTRRDTRLCVLCHTDQNTDPETGSTVEFKVLVHKIHSGHRLPSVEAGTPFFIVGNGQNVFDFSGVRWPQDTRNCQTCHTGAAQGDNFKTKPSVEACGSCHDNVNFTTGQNHPGGVQTNATCASCHVPDGPEFGLSVTGAHTIPEKSKQLRGVNFEIVSFTDTKPGQSPTVVFNIKDNAGQQIQPSEMASLSFILSGPTTDYTSPPTPETVTNATATGDGNFSYTFKGKIPADATGTYAVGIMGYLQLELKDPSGSTVKDNAGQTLAVRDVGFNKVAYGAVTDARPMPRKQVVDVKNCNVCHETLALHGGTRRNTELCVLCHNSQATDIGKRTTAKGPMPPESITFGRLVHRIHTGEELSEKPFIIYGGSPANPGPIDLSEVRFPTDQRNCTKCHLPGSNLLSNMRKDLQPTTVKVGDTVVSSTPPIQTVCLGCHDSGPAQTHAQAQTVNGKESCVVCHNENREFAVSKVHAR